jgi:predicted transcriptional regulator
LFESETAIWKMGMKSQVEPNAVPAADVLGLTSRIVAAYVGNNPVPASEVSGVLKSVHGTLQGLVGGTTGEAGQGTPRPAVPVKKSVTADYVVCLEDGKKLKMLKRYLRSRYGLSPDEYRAKWHLPADYPMVAPNYAARRSEFAKKIGLGRTKSSGKRRKR